MPGFYGTQLPAFRIPDQSLDFSPVISGLDSLSKSFERNRLLNEQKQIGSALNSATPQTSSQPPQSAPNRLLSLSSPQPSPAQGSAAAAGRELPQGDPMAAYKRAIAGIETPGEKNPYQAVGPATRTGDRAYGRFQVMGANIGPWTQEVFGRAMSPQEFLASPEAQEKLFEAKFGGYVRQTGDPAKAASMWFTGRPDAPNARASTPSGAPLGITGAEYVGKFNAGMGTPASSPQHSSVIPASSPQHSGTNYAAGIRTALAQGNLAVATQLMQAQRAEEASGQQSQLFPYQLEAAQSGATKDRAELENLATLQMGKVANAIQNAPEAARGAMWQRVIQSHPEMARALAENGVDPNNVAAGTGFFVSMAKGITPPKLTEVSPGATLVDTSDPTKGIFTAPRPAQNLSVAERKEVFDSDAAAQAGEGAIMSLRKALELNDTAYAGPLAQTRGYVTSLFGSEGGQATEDLNNLITSQALDQLKATFGAAPTEGERQILLDVQGSINQAPPVRKKIWERAIQMAERRVQFNRTQSEAIRSGDYFKSGFSPVASQQQTQPPAQGGTAPAAPATQQPRPVASKAEYDALPPGTQYIAPDGSVRTKQ